MPSPSNVFGSVLDGAQVEETVQKFLARWLPTYLSQLAADRGLPRDAWLRENWPPTWTNSTTFDLDETTRLPAILILSTGLADRPEMEGDGNYRAKWTVGIAAVVSANDQEATNRLAKRYGAAIRWLMIQHQSLEDPNVEGLSWEDEAYDDIPSGQRRTLASARLVFVIEYRHVVNRLDGPVLPDEPPEDPTVPIDDWGLLEDLDHVHITVSEEST